MWYIFYWTQRYDVHLWFLLTLFLTLKNKNLSAHRLPCRLIQQFIAATLYRDDDSQPISASAEAVCINDDVYIKNKNIMHATMGTTCCWWWSVYVYVVYAIIACVFSERSIATHFVLPLRVRRAQPHSQSAK